MNFEAGETNYDQMSDFEINCRVAREWLPCDYDINPDAQTVDLVGTVTQLGAHGTPQEKTERYGAFDPCGNVNHAWSIITEQRIGLTPSLRGDIWEADAGYSYRDSNPLRAAMIVYLMMQEDAEPGK